MAEGRAHKRLSGHVPPAVSDTLRLLPLTLDPEVVRVALERQSIEKKDFPIGRRGYDPEAVDAHLSALADEIDELKRSSRRRTETLASAASDQVRAIVEAAENSAAEIQRQAEEEAQEIRAEAASEAQSTREQATAQAREYVGKVSESTAVMLQRLDAMESELSALIESLRTGVEPAERRPAAARGQPHRGRARRSRRGRGSSPSRPPKRAGAALATARPSRWRKLRSRGAQAGSRWRGPPSRWRGAAEPMLGAAEPMAEAAGPMADGAEPTEQAAEPTGEVTVARTVAAEQPAEQPSADGEPDSGIHADPGAAAGLATGPTPAPTTPRARA